MTRTPPDQPQSDGRARKKSLKPVVEKKRRDRINQSLDELRRLLFHSTSDPRLQNPKIEKAEILDLAVEYLKKWTDRINLHDGCLHGPVKTPAALPPPLLSMETAGFQQCVARLTGHMHKITPAQRACLIERLKRHAESKNPKADFRQTAVETPASAPGEAICTSDSKESPGLLLPSQCPFQPHSCSPPCHEYLSPPPSPWYSPPFSMSSSSSSPFPSFACPFSSAPSSSPPSSNTSFFSFSPSLPYCSGLHVPPLTMLRAPTNPAHEEGPAPNSSSPMWRPWFR